MIAWTPDLVERMRALWATGATCAAIARELRITENAVAGKARRLGLPQRRVGSAGPAAVRLVRKPAPAGAPGLPLVGLSPHACRWPVWSDDTQHRFCGSARCEGSPYCAEHHAIAYVGLKYRPERPPAEFNVREAA